MYRLFEILGYFFIKVFTWFYLGMILINSAICNICFLQFIICVDFIV